MIDGGELVIILVIAVVLIGPKNLPRYADQLAQLIRKVKAFVTDTGGTLKKEMGADDLDFSQFDLRQYDPRRIVRETLLEDTPFGNKSTPPRTKTASTTNGAKDSSVAVAAGTAATATTVAAVTSTTTTEVAGVELDPATDAAIVSDELVLNFDDQAT